MKIGVKLFPVLVSESCRSTRFQVWKLTPPFSSLKRFIVGFSIFQYKHRAVTRLTIECRNTLAGRLLLICLICLSLIITYFPHRFFHSFTPVLRVEEHFEVDACKKNKLLHKYSYEYNQRQSRYPGRQTYQFHQRWTAFSH